MTEAPNAAVFYAAQVQLMELGRTLLAREAAGLPTAAREASLLDLRFGLERAAQLLPGPDQDAVLGYLIETYGLLAVGTDPFLRPLLPPVPATGAVVRYRVRAANGRAVGANARFIGAGAVLAPVPTP